MPIRIGDRLSQMKYVRSVAPVLLQFNSTGGIEVVYGIDPESFRAVSGGFVFLSGHDMAGPDDMLVDDFAARSKHLAVGDTFKLLDHDFHVAGIVEHGKGARVFVPLLTLQDLSGAHDKASLFFLKCTREDHTEAVMDQIRDIMPGYEIRPLKDFLSLMTSTNLPGLSAFCHQHDRFGRGHRLPGDFSFDVYHGDRTNTGHRSIEIHGRLQRLYHPRFAQ